MAAMRHDIRLALRGTRKELLLAYMAGYIWNPVRENMTTLRRRCQIEPSALSGRLGPSFPLLSAPQSSMYLRSPKNRSWQTSIANRQLSFL